MRRAIGFGGVVAGALVASVVAGPGCARSDAAPATVGAETVVAERGASVPTVAIDPRSGRAYAAWVGEDGGVSGVYLSAAEAGSGRFGPPVRVNDLPGDAAPHKQAPAQVAVGPEGTVYVVWQNNTEIEGRRFPASDVRLAVSTDGGRTFRPAITVNDDAGGPPSSHTFHDVEVTPDGAVYVSWIDSRVRDRLRAAHPTPAEAEHGAHGGHGMGEEGLPGPEIRVARSADGGRSFGASVVVAADACPCCRTTLAAGPDGEVYLAWRQVMDGGVRDVVVARSEPGRLAFAAPVRVHADGWVYDGCPHAGPSLAVDAAGGVHVGWYTGREGRQGLWYAASRDGARTFGEAVPILTDEWVPPSRVELAAAGPTVWLAWEDRRAAAPAWSLGRATPGGIVRATATGRPGESPSLAAAADRAVLAWSRDGGVRAAEVGIE